MNTRLIIDGNAVYEIDEDCLACRGRRTDADAVWNRDPAPGDEARLYRNWNLPVKNHKLTNKERCGIM